MAGIEGTNRIKKIGNLVVVGGALAGLIMWSFCFITHQMERWIADAPFVTAVIVFGVILRMAGFVVEGFLLPSSLGAETVLRSRPKHG